MKYLDRSVYSEKLNSSLNNGKLKLISGLLGTGKTAAVYHFIESIYDDDPDANIVYIDLFHKYYEDLKTGAALTKYVLNRYKKDRKNYLFIDEIQLCVDYMLVLESLSGQCVFDIYILTSVSLYNSLSGKYGSGAITCIDFWPLGFSDFLKICNDYSDNGSILDTYISEGGIAPLHSPDNINSDEYLGRLFSKITGYGMTGKLHVQDRGILTRIQKILVGNISASLSPNKVASLLKAKGINANHITIGRYIKFLTDLFLFYPVKRLDLKTGAVLETLQKYYLSDISLGKVLAEDHKLSGLQIHENLVFLELKRRGYCVYTGKIYQKEISFAAVKQDRRIYIQIANLTDNEDAIDAAIKSMVRTGDAWPKYVITDTGTEGYVKNGVKIENIEEWLLKADDMGKEEMPLQ